MKTKLPVYLLLASLLAAPTANADPAEALAAVVVRPHAVAQGLSFDGVVEAVVQSTVAARIAGRILDLRVDAGQAVKQGEVLLRIDAREASEAAQSARSQLAVAQAQYARSRQLREQNFISQAGLDKARAEYDAAKAGAAQAGVGVDYATVTSPLTGLVARRHAEAGEMATPGRPLLTVYDPSALRVSAAIPQDRLAEVRKVRTARIEFPALQRRVDSPAVTLLPIADAATHVSTARIALPFASEGVVPGLFARVTFVTGEVEKLTVPASALVRRGELTAVYVLPADDGTPVLRRIRIGETYAGEVEVLAGLADGERVAVDPAKAAIRLRSGR